MDNNTKKNIIETDEDKNYMLKNYKELVVLYEESRQIYEKAIKEYESHSNETSVLGCSQIVAYVDESQNINWKIVLLDGTIIYKSGTFDYPDTFILDLSTLNLETGTQFKLIAYIQELGVDGDVYAKEILTYNPASSTVYYKLNSNDEVQYIYMIESPYSPPILQCTSLSVHNTALVITKYEIRLASTGKTIYTSDNYDITSTWTYNLANLNVAAGTQLILHAGVIAGNDSEPYVTILYNPKVYNATPVAHFTLVGATIDTTIIFDGAKSN